MSRKFNVGDEVSVHDGLTRMRAHVAGLVDRDGDAMLRVRAGAWEMWVRPDDVRPLAHKFKVGDRVEVDFGAGVTHTGTVTRASDDKSSLGIYVALDDAALRHAWSICGGMYIADAAVRDGCVKKIGPFRVGDRVRTLKPTNGPEEDWPHDKVGVVEEIDGEVESILVKFPDPNNGVHGLWWCYPQDLVAEPAEAKPEEAEPQPALADPALVEAVKSAVQDYERATGCNIKMMSVTRSGTTYTVDVNAEVIGARK